MVPSDGPWLWPESMECCQGGGDNAAAAAFVDQCRLDANPRPLRTDQRGGVHERAYVTALYKHHRVVIHLQIGSLQNPFELIGHRRFQRDIYRSLLQRQCGEAGASQLTSSINIRCLGPSRSYA